MKRKKNKSRDIPTTKWYNISMTQMIEFLKGKKTYIVAGLALCVLALGYIGVLDIEVANQIATFLGFGGMLTLRDAISNGQR